MGWDILDLASKVASPQQVRHLLRFIKRLLGIEEFFGELSTSARLGDANFARDLAELVFLIAGEQPGHFIPQPLALGEFFEIRAVGNSVLGFVPCFLVSSISSAAWA